MKKIILLLVLALSLNAGGNLCDDSWDRYMKQYDLYKVAKARGDVLSMKIRVALSIAYIEETIDVCGEGWKFKENAEGIREALFDTSDVLERY